MTERCQFQVLGIRCCLKPHGEEVKHQAFIADVLTLSTDLNKVEAQRALASASRLCPIGVYAHRKGGTYVVFAHSVGEESLQPLVHYYSVDRGTRWTRTITDFTELVDGKPRFERVRDASDSELRLVGIRIDGGAE